MSNTADLLFIDTSVFVQENFLEGKRMQTILDLAAKGYVKLMFSQITLNEIKNQFKKRVGIAIEQHNIFINDKARHGISVLRNNLEGQAIIKKLPNEKVICSEFNALFDEELLKANAKTLPYPTLDISVIFESYFSGKPPFGTGEKKHEFPDAFAIAQIEQWCDDHKAFGTILSNDKDFATASGKSIRVITDYESYLNDKLQEVIESKRLAKLEELYNLKSEYLDKEIVIWVEEQFDDDSLFDDVTNWMEVLERTIEYVKVVSKEYELIGSTEDFLEIEITAIVSYRVALETYDEHTGTYDSEDKVMLYRDTTICIAEQEDLEFSLKIRFNIVSDEDFDTDYEIIEFNDNKDIVISPDGANDYY